MATDVTFDGTWMTQGHKSHISVCFVIEAYTRTILDMEVLSNHCIVCKDGKVEKKHSCHKNYEGKSGAKEKEGAVRLWSRSTQDQMKYMTFVGDGDSSAYSAVCSLNEGR